jgi:ribose transport system permease protein
MSEATLGFDVRGRTRLRIRRRLEAFAVDYGVLVTAIGLTVFFGFKSQYFLTSRNLLNIGNFAAETGIIAIAFTITLIAGQIDVSFIGSYALSSVAIGELAETYHLPIVVALLGAFAVCWLVGLGNAILVVRFGIPAIVATIGTGTVAASAAALWDNGQLLFLSSRSSLLVNTMRAKPLGIPTPMLILVGVLVAGWLFLSKTRVGWHVYAIGGNPSAAVRTGLPVARITYFVFFLTATAAAAAGLIDTGRLGFSNSGGTTTTSILAASLMGGAGLVGGTGKAERTIFGVLLVSVLANGLTLLNVDQYMVYFWTAVVLILAVAWAGVATKRSA